MFTAKKEFFENKVRKKTRLFRSITDWQDLLSSPGSSERFCSHGYYGCKKTNVRRKDTRNIEEAETRFPLELMTSPIASKKNFQLRPGPFDRPTSAKSNYSRQSRPSTAKNQLCSYQISTFSTQQLNNTSASHFPKKMSDEITQLYELRNIGTVEQCQFFNSKVEQHRFPRQTKSLGKYLLPDAESFCK